MVKADERARAMAMTWTRLYHIEKWLVLKWCAKKGQNVLLSLDEWLNHGMQQWGYIASGGSLKVPLTSASNRCAASRLPKCA